MPKQDGTVRHVVCQDAATLSSNGFGAAVISRRISPATPRRCPTSELTDRHPSLVHHRDRWSFSSTGVARNKRAALNKIKREIYTCRRCRQGAVGKPVVGEGNPDADVVFVGEAPGRKEAESGRPFVGRAGQWLRAAIENIGLDKRSVYLTSPVKYRRPRRKPSAADVAHGRTHLLQQLDVIDPRIVVLLGSVACLAALNQHVPVRDRHGNVIERDGRRYLITCHPAAAARFPEMRKAILQDFRKLKVLVAKSRRG